MVVLQADACSIQGHKFEKKFSNYLLMAVLQADANSIQGDKNAKQKKL